MVDQQASARSSSTSRSRRGVASALVGLLVASGLAIGSAGIAGFLPARKASRGNPVDIIRGAT